LTQAPPKPGLLARVGKRIMDRLSGSLVEPVLERAVIRALVLLIDLGIDVLNTLKQALLAEIPQAPKPQAPQPQEKKS